MQKQIILKAILLTQQNYSQQRNHKQQKLQTSNRAKHPNHKQHQYNNIMDKLNNTNTTTL